MTRRSKMSLVPVISIIKTSDYFKTQIQSFLKNDIIIIIMEEIHVYFQLRSNWCSANSLLTEFEG